MAFDEITPQFPLSTNEHAAVARCVAELRKQLQEVSELFGRRYGRESNLTDLAGKALVCTTLLEHELIYSAPLPSEHDDGTANFTDHESDIVKAALSAK